MSRGQSFVKGALILTSAGLGVRLLGAGLRVFLGAIMGDEGIGLYQMAYPVYTALLAVSTAGIPIAVSKLVAENIAKRDYRGAHRVFKTALVMLTLLGAVFSLLLYFGAETFIRWLELDPRAFYPLVTVSPAIFIVSIMSSFRGYFQGQQEMQPTAFSQIIEQLGRIGVAIALVYLLIPTGLEFAAAGATFGAVSGAFLSLLVLLLIFFRRRSEFKMLMQKQVMLRDFSHLDVIVRIATFSIPITLASLVIPLVNMVDLAVVPNRLLSAGFTMVEATALYGQLTGMANPVIQFPVLLTIALAMSLVPAISEAQALHNRALIVHRTNLAMRITMFFGIPSAIGLFVLAEPTTIVLYDNVNAAYPLSILAFSIVFLALYTATSGVLQGLGQTMEPVKNMMLGASVKLVLSWFLTAVPTLNIGGTAISTVVGFMLASLLNMRKVSRLTGWQFKFYELVGKPLIAALFMGMAVSFVYGALMGSFLPAEPLPGVEAAETVGRTAYALALFASVFFGMFVYVVLLFLVGGVKREDLMSLPRVGERLTTVAEKLRLFKG